MPCTARNGCEKDKIDIILLYTEIADALLVYNRNDVIKYATGTEKSRDPLHPPHLKGDWTFSSQQVICSYQARIEWIFCSGTHGGPWFDYDCVKI